MKRVSRLFKTAFRMPLLRWLTLRRVLVISAVLLPLAVALVVALRAYSAWQASGQIYAFEDVPERPVALVFGAQVYRSGRLSAMLADRVAVGARLYHAGKVQALLLTGDNHLETYNEPEAMRRYALELGVPADALVLDYAGFRTYDSCYRARDIFKVNSAILVTQGFHLDRALLTCGGLGLDVVGVAADFVRPSGYSAVSLFRSQLRELPATAMAVLDLLRGDQPAFLGEPLPIFADAG
ncbi:MAG: YdcF family protein [Chloroflexi bacterium]|nr:YdcF family protein [Chloroflexota bacterium]